MLKILTQLFGINRKPKIPAAVKECVKGFQKRINTFDLSYTFSKKDVTELLDFLADARLARFKFSTNITTDMLVTNAFRKCVLPKYKEEEHSVVNQLCDQHFRCK